MNAYMNVEPLEHNTDSIIQLPSPYYGPCKDRSAPKFGPEILDS